MKSKPKIFVTRLSSTNRFKKIFQWLTEQQIRNKAIIKNTAMPSMSSKRVFTPGEIFMLLSVEYCTVSQKTVPTYFFAPCMSNMNRFQ